MDLAQMTAAGGSIELGGRTLLLRHLDLRDRARVEQFIRSKLKRPMAVAADATKDLEPLRFTNPDLYNRMAEAAAVEAMRMQREDVIDGPAANALMASSDGLSFWLWLRIRKDQPDVTKEQVLAWLEQEDTKTLAKKIDALVEAERGATGQADPPKPAP